MAANELTLVEKVPESGERVRKERRDQRLRRAPRGNDPKGPGGWTPLAPRRTLVKIYELLRDNISHLALPADAVTRFSVDEHRLDPKWGMSIGSKAKPLPQRVGEVCNERVLTPNEE